jgi:hypothetical protein
MNTNKKTIALVGLIGSGKDTVADYLQNIHHFRRESFARTLKDAVSSVFNWDREMLEGRTEHSREWREEVDKWWAERLGIPDLTPRWVLQYWGTDVLRKNFHNDIWIASLENKLRSNRDNIVISDCRFINEITAVQNQGGLVVRIKRGEDPLWLEAASVYNTAQNSNERKKAKVKLDEMGVHQSEADWAGYNFDHVLYNDYTLTELYDQINNLLEDHQISTPNLLFE